MNRRARATLKALLPEALRVRLRRGETYATRLIYWAHIVRNVRGVGGDDRRAVWLAFLRSPVSALSDIDKWQDPKLTRDARVRIEGVGLFDVRAGADDLHHVYPGREPEVFRAIHTWLRPGDVFVDAGANIGFYSVLASSLIGPEGRVIAVEMMPDTAAILRKHVEINGAKNVTIIERALSDAADCEIEARVEQGKFGQASIRRNDDGVVVRVLTTTLDNIMDGIGPIRLMKLDLEGAERSALEGAGAVLNRVDAILFESLPGADDAAPLLIRHGFTVSSLNGRDHIAIRDIDKKIDGRN